MVGFLEAAAASATGPAMLDRHLPPTQHPQIPARRETNRGTGLAQVPGPYLQQVEGLLPLHHGRHQAVYQQQPQQPVNPNAHRTAGAATRSQWRRSNVWIQVTGSGVAQPECPPRHGAAAVRQAWQKSTCRQAPVTYPSSEPPQVQTPSALEAAQRDMIVTSGT